MKALRFNSFGDLAGALHVEEVPTPVAGPDEVLVKVYAASLNPSDWKNVLRAIQENGSSAYTRPRLFGRCRRRGQGDDRTGDMGNRRGCRVYAGRKPRRVYCHSQEGRAAEAEESVLHRGGLRGKDLHHGLCRVDRKGAAAGRGNGASHRRKRGRGKFRCQACENEIRSRHRGGPPGPAIRKRRGGWESIWPLAAFRTVSRIA